MTNTNYPSATPQSSPQPRSGNNKNIVIGVLAAALLGTWGYWLYKNNQSAQEIQLHATKETAYLSARDSVQMLYNETLTRLDSLTGNNNNLRGQLSDKESEITKLRNNIQKILRDKNASQADLARAKKMISELNDKISNLEADNARLTGENQQLTSTNTQLTTEKATLEQNLQTTTAEKEELATTVDVASTFSASNIQIVGMKEKSNGKEKATTSAKRVDKLVLSFDVENRIAKSGPAEMYVIVTAPDGKVISDVSMNSGSFTSRNEGDKTYTSKIDLNYEQGTRKGVQMPIRQKDFQTGDYKIEVYHNGFKIGEGVRTLKKGGLFG